MTTVAHVFADVHFHEWADFATINDAGVNSRLANQLDTLLSIKADGTFPVVIAGDIVHKRGQVSSAVQWAVARWLRHLADNYSRIIIVPGNHDYPLKAGVSWLHSLTGFSELMGDKIIVCDVPTEFALPGAGPAIGVPWMADLDEWQEAMEHGANNAVLCFSHIAVAGASVSGRTYMGNGAQIEKLPDYELILLGDFHNHQQVADNCYYVGAPQQHNWGDAGFQDLRGYISIVNKDNKLTIEHHKLDTPMFIEVDSMADVKDDGNFYRLRVTSETNAADVEKARDAGIAIVKEIAPPTEARMALKPGATAHDVIEQYFNGGYYGGALDAAELKMVCKSYADAAAKNDKRPAASGAMRILSVTATDFLGYAQLEASLDKTGIVLLEGVNKDDPDAQSNGSGKSTIAEATAAALYGKTLRNIPVAEWVRRGCKGCQVGAEVQTTRGTLQIVRKRNMPETEVVAWLDGKRIDSTARDFQQQIDELLGMDFNMFTQVACFGQEVDRVFAEETDAGRKELFENLVGGDVFAGCETEAKATRDTLQQVEASTRANIVKLEGEAESVERSIETRQREESEWAAQHEVTIKEVTAELAEAEKTLADVEQTVKQAEKEFKEAQEKVDATRIVALQKQFDALNSEQVKISKECITLEAKLIALTKDADRHGLDVERLSGAVAQCSECGQPIGREKQAQLAAAAKEKHAGVIAQIEAEREKLNEKRAEAENLQKRYAEAAGELQEAKSGMAEVNHKEQLLAGADNTLEAVKRNYADKKSYLETLRGTTINPHTKQLEKLVEYKEAIANKLKKYKTDLLGIEEGLLYTQEAARLFGNQGLKTFLFDSLAPAITEEANKALEILSSGSLSVDLRTERKGKSEKIVLDVRNDLGAASFGGNSGGQKRKVNLAICWAIAKLANNRVNVLFIDEAFDALDAVAGERVCTLLADRANVTDSIIVITHRAEFKESFGKVWTAERSNNISMLKVR